MNGVSLFRFFSSSRSSPSRRKRRAWLPRVEGRSDGGVQVGIVKALAASKPRRKLLHGVANCQPNSRLASSAILLHILPMSAQCGYNAIDGRGHRKPLKNP